MKEERKDQILKLLILVVAAGVILFGTMSIQESNRTLDRLHSYQEQLNHQESEE